MDADHLQRFAGIGRLYGRAGMERLARSSFLVVGLGGVGSWTVEALARSGVGHLSMVDGWVDDGQADKGDFLVRRDAALLRLSAE